MTLHQNSTINSFLNVNCNTESKLILINIFNCITLKSLLHFAWFFNPHITVTPCIGHLKSIGSLNYVFKWIQFILQSQKIIFDNIITNLIRKISNYWEAVKLVALDTSFQNSKLCLKALISLTNQLFSLK